MHPLLCKKYYRQKKKKKKKTTTTTTTTTRPVTLPLAHARGVTSQLYRLGGTYSCIDLLVVLPEMAQSLSRSSYYFFHACLCLSLLSVSLRVAKAAGNIDVLEPIVRISPVRGTLGRAAPPANVSGDYFGFSVALHQIKVPSSFDEALNSTRYIPYLISLSFYIKNANETLSLVQNH